MSDFHCHCGWKTRCFDGVGYADPPRCDLCDCYMMFPFEKESEYRSGKFCMLEIRKRYPYLQSVVDYIATLPHKMEFYTKAKVAKQFNLTKEEVATVFRQIEEMNEDKSSISYRGLNE